MRLTGRTPFLATAAASVALVVVSMLASLGEPGVPEQPTGDRTVTLESGPAAAAAGGRAIRVPVVSLAKAEVPDAKGTPDLSATALAHLDIPDAALAAYQRAAAVLAQVDEPCGLQWTLLAAIGRIESDHGRFAGAALGTDGVSSPEIRGVSLDGAGPVARIRDTDGGQLDGDPVWDRAVGPMQFLPSTWAVVGVDADGDGVRSPDDLDDAALAAAVFLCSGPGDLSTREGRAAAVFRYNPSQSYVASVLELEQAYRDGDFGGLVGGLGESEPVDVVVLTRSGSHTVGTIGGRGGSNGQHGGSGQGGQHGDQTASAAGPVGDHSSTPSPHGSDPTDPSSPSDDGSPGTPSAPGTPDSIPDAPHTPSTPHGTPPPPSTPGTPSDPPSTPSDPPDTPSDPPDTPGTPSDPPDSSDPPSTTPDPPEPSPVTLTGVLTACGPDDAQDEGAWCLDGQLLDVGDAAFLASPALADLDADGTVETNTEELAGLAGTQVSVLAAAGTSPPLVLAVNGTTYAPGE